MLDKALALSRSEKLIQDASRVTWKETAEDFGARLRAAADFVNTHYDAEGLQRELPARLAELRNREGGRIGK